MKYKQESLRLDDTLRIAEEPWKWPGTPPGRTGLRWIVRNGAGEIVAMGDVGNPNSAWRKAWAALKYPEAKALGEQIAKEAST